MIMFDSQSEFFRCPQGAIKEDEKIALNIYIKRCFPCSPSVIIEKRNDYDKNLIRKVPLEWKSTFKNYDLYGVEFIIEQCGHYFYSFDFGRETKSPKNLYQLLIYKKDYITPKWIKGGIIYHIFVDRFFRDKIRSKDDDILIRHNWGGTPNFLSDKNGKIKNDDFFGGNLDGIISKIPYLHSLGITAIYLSPIFEAHSNHKYDVGNFFKIDPMFGGDDSLKNLCCEAKKYGMHVILDLVLSHTGDDSVYFNKYGSYDSVGAYQSKSSPYFSWYKFNSWNDDYSCWWNIKILPTLNKENKNYRSFIMGNDGVLKHYLKEGVKGYRLDVADELPNDFLDELRISVKSYDEEALIIGEVWEDAADKYAYGKLKEYFLGKQLDSVTNYPIRTAIINYVKNKDCSLLSDTMNLISEKYPKEALNCIMNILSTHDTARILTVLGSDESPKNKNEMSASKLSPDELEKGIKMLKIAALIQMTLPGIPCIYYGDEAGTEGWTDPFNRTCFPWGHENQEILKLYFFLTKLRKSSRLFIDGKYRCLIHDKGVYIYERYDHEKKIIIAVNLSLDEIFLNFNDNFTDYETGKSAGKFSVEPNKFIILQN